MEFRVPPFDVEHRHRRAQRRRRTPSPTCASRCPSARTSPLVGTTPTCWPTGPTRSSPASPNPSVATLRRQWRPNDRGGDRPCDDARHRSDRLADLPRRDPAPHGDTVLASLITPVIYLVQPPEAPMLSATWVQLPSPIAFGADGTLVDAGFPSTLAPGGALRTPLEAVADATAGLHPHGPLDLVIDPMVVAQARDLADGYRTSDGTEVARGERPTRQADAFLRTLSSVVATTGAVETVANPYANPLLPAMLRSGLATSLDAQRVAGDNGRREPRRPRGLDDCEAVRRATLRRRARVARRRGHPGRAGRRRHLRPDRDAGISSHRRRPHRWRPPSAA